MSDDDALDRYPLKPFGGERPPAPDWFARALADAPERRLVDAAGARVELLTWGRPGAPGLLLIHGAGAHADWWSFIAPLLADRWRVAALSLSGMGASDRRAAYSIQTYADEAFAAAEAAGLFQAEEPPLFAAHSFGARAVVRAAAGARGHELKGVVVLDSYIPVPGEPAPGRPFSDRSTRVYAAPADALARFRLVPPQPCANPYVLDHVARTGLRRSEAGDGWVWAFDPQMFNRLTDGDSAADLAAARCPVAMIYGALSPRAEPSMLAKLQAIAPEGTPISTLPLAHHHLMLDQPVALAACLRTLFSAWPGPG